MLEDALRYLSLGYAVIPVRSSVKGGPPFAWAEFQRHRPTREQVEKWFAGWQDGLAVITGRVSGLVVLDLDHKGEHDGRRIVESLYGWEPKGPLARTGGGGLHAYYAHPGTPVRNAVSIQPAVDVRADGGFVYAPPSPHPSGKRYEWITPPWEAGLPACPQWLLDELASVTASERQDAEMDAFSTLLAQGVEEGHRNDTAARLAGHYIALGLSAQEVFCILRTWNERNQPPLADHELEKVVRSIAKKEAVKRGVAGAMSPENSASDDERHLVIQALQERFGIPLTEIVRIDGTQPRYRFICGDRAVEFEARQLESQTAFRKAMIEVTERMPSKVGAKANPGWDYYAQQMMNVACHIDPGEDASEVGRLKDWISGHLAGAYLRKEDEPAEDPTDPWQGQNGRVYVHLNRLRKYVEADFGERLPVQRLAQMLSAQGAESSEFQIPDVKERRHHRRFWRVPDRLLSQRAHTIGEKKNENPPF